MKALMAWWGGLSARERRMVSLVGVVLVITVAWLAIIEPLQASRAKLEQDVPAQRELLSWMHSVSGQLGTSGRTVGVTGQSLFALVDRSIRVTPLADSVQRLQPEGQDSVRIWLDNAPFDDLVRWLATLERDHGVTPVALSLDRGTETGRVNARVTLGTPAR